MHRWRAAGARVRRRCSRRHRPPPMALPVQRLQPQSLDRRRLARRHRRHPPVDQTVQFGLLVAIHVAPERARTPAATGPPPPASAASRSNRPAPPRTSISSSPVAIPSASPSLLADSPKADNLRATKADKSCATDSLRTASSYQGPKRKQPLTRCDLSPGGLPHGSCSSLRSVDRYHWC